MICRKCPIIFLDIFGNNIYCFCSCFLPEYVNTIMPNKSSETKRFSFLWMPWTARPMRHILSSLLPTMPTQIQGWPTKNQVSKPKEFKFGYYFFYGSEWWFRSSKRNRKPKKMANKVNEKITRGFFVFQIANSWTSIIFSASTFSKFIFFNYLW